MDDPTLSNLLRRFGLSEKEIDTYLALLEHGEAKASTVADEAGVSKRYVYSVSEKLEERGFVSVNDHAVPTRIRAEPPEEGIERLAENVEAMRPGLEARFTDAEPRSEQFEVVKSRVTVVKRIQSLVAEADEEIALSLPADLLAEVGDELRAAVDRGALVLLVIAGADPDEEFDLAGLASAARTWSESTPTMVTADRARSVLAPPEMIARSNSDKQAISFTQDQLAPVMVGSFFGNYWPMATEVYVIEPAALPRTFSGFRHAVLQATLHVRAGTDLRATIRGRLIGAEGGPTEIEGRVTEVRQGLASPVNNAFPVENTMLVETESGRYSVGGEGAFVEDFEADEVELRSG